MILAVATALLVAQAAAPSGPPPSAEESRLVACKDQARSDPATAIATASGWLSEAQGPGRSAPQQCLGFAYTSLLRWGAAESAFLAAREALLPADRTQRARLAAMAGNAALAGGRGEAALAAFDLGEEDARVAGDRPLAGIIATDRARALVALDRPAQAAEALALARRDAPQDASAWLLSATLARREDRLEEARGYIRTAADLAPQDLSIVLEAGLIAEIGRASCRERV